MTINKSDPWIIYNGFLNSQKFSEHVDWLITAASARGIHLVPKKNSDILLMPGRKLEEVPACVLFWDKDVRLARYLESLYIPVYNSAKAIAVCDDKSQTHLALAKVGLPEPDTIVAPMTFGNIGYTDLGFLANAVDALGFPMVVKECYGSFGWQVYLSNDLRDLEDIVRKIGAKPFLMQRYVKTSHGRDVRLQVVGDKVVASMERYSTNGDFRANLSSGGSMKPYVPTKEEVLLATAAVKAVGADFAGVDLLFGSDGPLVCEVNSNAHFRNIYDCTGVNVAEAIIDWILEKQ